MWRIKFKGDDYLFIGDTPRDGAITTKELYENFEESFAHLFSNGEIKRFNKIIGHRNDIQFLERVSRPKVSPSGKMQALFTDTLAKPSQKAKRKE